MQDVYTQEGQEQLVKEDVAETILQIGVAVASLLHKLTVCDTIVVEAWGGVWEVGVKRVDQ